MAKDGDSGQPVPVFDYCHSEQKKKSQINIYYFPLVHQASYLTVEGNMVAQA